MGCIASGNWRAPSGLKEHRQELSHLPTAPAAVGSVQLRHERRDPFLLEVLMAGIANRQPGRDQVLAAVGLSADSLHGIGPSPRLDVAEDAAFLQPLRHAPVLFPSGPPLLSVPLPGEETFEYGQDRHDVNASAR
jgi:hypothetical protein